MCIRVSRNAGLLEDNQGAFCVFRVFVARNPVRGKCNLLTKASFALLGLCELQLRRQRLEHPSSFVVLGPKAVEAPLKV